MDTKERKKSTSQFNSQYAGSFLNKTQYEALVMVIKIAGAYLINRFSLFGAATEPEISVTSRLSLFYVAELVGTNVCKKNSIYKFTKY